MGWLLFFIYLIILFSVVDHGQCGCEDAGVISETWSSSSPVERDLVQCGGDHAGYKHIFAARAKLEYIVRFVCRQVW